MLSDGQLNGAFWKTLAAWKVWSGKAWLVPAGLSASLSTSGVQGTRVECRAGQGRQELLGQATSGEQKKTIKAFFKT